MLRLCVLYQENIEMMQEIQEELVTLLHNNTLDKFNIQQFLQETYKYYC